jgi:large subunit ribosomal protein L17
MRHRKSFNHLGRTSTHRKAMLSNMAASLILHKRSNTTVAKAKALRTYVEPLITKAKDDTTHSRRVVFSHLQNKFAVTELFREVSAKIGDRPGGYTRIIKLGNRQGDNADMAMIELVDYNELLISEKEDKKAKSSRRRRGGSSKKSTQQTTPATKTDTKVERPVEEVNQTTVEASEKKEPTNESEAVKEDPKANVEEVKTKAKDEGKKEPKVENKAKTEVQEDPKKVEDQDDKKVEKPKAKTEDKKEVKKEEPKAEDNKDNKEEKTDEGKEKEEK